MRTRVRKQPIIALYFESETTLKFYNLKTRSTSLSQSPREWQKYFELSEVRHWQNVTSTQYDVHVGFLQNICLRYMCSQTAPTENRIEMKTRNSF